MYYFKIWQETFGLVCLALLLPAQCVMVSQNSRMKNVISQLRGGRQQQPWEPCAIEDEPLGLNGLVRFGFGDNWVEAELPAGAICAASSFGGVDPISGVRKSCECALQAHDFHGAESRDELGVTWSKCAQENAACQCNSGTVRFGVGNRWVKLDAQLQPQSMVNCTATSFEEQDPATGVQKQCWCMQEAGERLMKQSTVRVGIVTVTRHPPDLLTWLKYHMGFAKVDHIFMQIEDSPELGDRASVWQNLSDNMLKRLTLWRSPSVSSLVDVSPQSADKRPEDDYESLQKRQVRAMHRAMLAARQLGLDWLFHIDDDELLYSPMRRPLGETLAAIPHSFEQVYVPNVEAVYESAAVHSCFTETKQVNVNRYKFVSYANGKAAVRVRAATSDNEDEEMVPAGPHQWRTAYGTEPPSIHLDQEPFGPPVMVVHFESCPFHRWQDKYWELGNTSPEKINQIPFPFYRESIERMQRCRDAESFQAQSDECTGEALMKLWASWKTRANSDLKPADLMPIRIDWGNI